MWLEKSAMKFELLYFSLKIPHSQVIQHSFFYCTRVMSCQLPPHSFLYRTRYIHLSKEEVLPWHLENVFLVYVSTYLKRLQFMKLNFLNNKNTVLFLLHTLYSNCGASKDYTQLQCNKGVTGRMVYFHHWHCLELLFPVICRSPVPQCWQVFPKIWVWSNGIESRFIAG